MARNFAAYAVHKQMYPATYNFRDEDDGTAGTDIGFVDGATLYDGSCVIVASWQSHRKVLRLQDDATAGEDPIIIHNITQATSGTNEFWIGTNDVTGTWYFSLYENGVDYIVRLRITGSALEYRDNADVWQNIQAVSNNTFYHIRITWRADNTFDCYVDGTKQVNNQGTNNNMVSGIDRFRIVCYGDSTDYIYLDAYGESSDASYAIGDNVDWRHYTDQDSDFESEDWGTSGTSIGFVDGADAYDGVIDIVPFFSEHKKVLRLQDDATAGEDPYIYHTMTQATSGIVEFFMRVTSITQDFVFFLYDSGVGSIVRLAFRASNIKYLDSASAWQTIQSATADTWYHFKIQWYADDTFDVWVDNILKVDGADSSAGNNQVGGIDRFYVRAYADGTEYCYLDAFSHNTTSGNAVGDNRTFDYNTTYTKEDITTDVKDIVQENNLHKWRTAALTSISEYTQAVVFFQAYDITSKLGGEFEIKNSYFQGGYYIHLLRDKNADALKTENSNTWSSDKIHDATDSTSMIKTILPNVGHEEGRLLLVNADSETDTYSLRTLNYPDYLQLRDISYLANSVCIVEASGKIDLDSDKASGDSLDVSSDTYYLLNPPVVSNIQEDINYFDVYGMFDPATKLRFHKNIDNSSGSTKRSWSITNNNLKNQTDVDNYATAIATRITDIKQIRLNLVGIQTHSMGETLTLTYNQSPYSITATAFYIISEKYFYDAGKSTLILSEGLVEKEDFSQGYDPSQNETNINITNIVDSDKVTFEPEVRPYDGATDNGFYITLDAVGEKILCHFYVESNIDPSRDITITILYQRGDANNDEVTIQKVLRYAICDGTETAWTSIWALVADTFTDDANNEYNKKIFTVDASDINDGALFNFYINLNEAARTINVFCVSVTYYIKRSIS